eukprot:GFUD01001814.1.p1 GENE.GFUD01001814.1~~GFUD01001814.1.p1  ORF type:complete len:1623 (+),score=612.15 GFUD01001814.1:145-4869(+)
MDTSEVNEEVNDAEEKTAPDEDIDSEEANARARAAVLQDTSSPDSEQANIAPTDQDDNTSRKKLKTKKVLDQMRRKSAGEDGSQEKCGSSDEEKEPPTTPKVKKNKVPVPKSTSTPRPEFGSGSASGSGKDLMGLSCSDEEAAKKGKKKKIKVQNGGGSDGSAMKRSKTKSGSKSSDHSESGGSDVDSDEKSYRRKQKKREKRNLKAYLEDLNEVASKINLVTNKQLNKETRVNIQDLNTDIKSDLKEFDEVDITSHSSLAKLSSGKSAGDRDIDRLCDFKSLKKSRRTSEETDSEDEEHKQTKEQRHREKREKKAATGLGDMSSDSNGEQHSNKEESEEDNTPEGFKSQNDLAKQAVLATSSEDENNDAGDLSSDEQQKTPVKEKAKKEKRPKKVYSDSDSDSSKPKRKNKPALLSMKLSETESSADEAKYRSKMEKKAAAAKEAVADSDDSPGSSDIAQSSAQKKKEKSKKRKVLSSDTENGASDSEQSAEEEESEYEQSDSSVDKKKKRNRRKKDSSSDDSDSDRPKKKRKRIKDGSESEDEDEDASPNKGRHEIRRILKDKNLTESTKEAAAEERERRKRIEDRQALYNKTFSLPEGKREGENVTGQLVLDFDPETMDILVEVNKKLVKKLKPHQVKGVKFMWDACFESIAQIKSGKLPGGAILAHCMGLGKTLQTITLTHTVLDNRKVPVSRVMVICPVNTVKNWQDEYDKWLTGDLEVDVFEMSMEKDNWARSDRMNQWYREGGVLIIGYEMFRNLVNEKNNKFKKKQRETFNSCLLDPGPDLVICDEGHLLKNEKSAITKAVNRIKTLRRIVLTGTPLQNNLKEYYEMVNFVKPHLLGSRKEFMNRFVNPIVNGQHSDSTERDVRTMKKRSFILSDLLKGCMQRLDYNVLVPYLQPKQEYVISIALTDLQKRLYKYYLENYAKAGQIGRDGKLEGGKKGGLFYDVQNLSRIWNHPCILLLAKQRKEDKEDLDDEGSDDEEGSLKDFICDEDTGDSGNDVDSDIQELDSEGIAKTKTVTRSDKPDDLVPGLEKDPIGGHKGWWNSFLGDEDKLDELRFGNKMVLLMDVLKESALIGDKVLVFSQSLLSLDLIEDFLSRVNAAHEDTDRTGEAAMADYLDTWIPGKDYYRMDGSTAADTRKIWCKYFNRTTSHRMRLFLISTKAGGLGINLVAANRVIIFDASWNPSHDVQSIFRVFRFGQTKPVYIYRFLAKGTMEEKIYDRQVTKQSLSARVVDEQQIERHFTMNELSELYEFNDEPLSDRPIPEVPKDRLLAELVDKHKELVWSIKNHDSLLEAQVDENLTEEDRKTAWEEYEQERKGMIQTNVGIENTQQFGMMLQSMLPKSGDGRIMASPINPMAIQAQLRQMNPELSHDELVARTRAAIMQLQNMHRTQTPVIVNQNTLNVGQRNTTGYDQSFYQAEMAKAKAMINQQYPGMYRFGFRGPNPHGPGSNPMASVSNMANMSNMRRPSPAPSHAGEVITLDGGPETGPPPMARMPVRAASPGMRGGRGGRGGRRGRPRLDPDTDLDFSPEPSSSAHNEMLLARLQQAGMSVSPASGSKPSSGNES